MRTGMKKWLKEGFKKVKEIRGKCLKTLRHTDNVRCLQILSSRLLVSGSGDATIKVWNTTSTTCLKTLRGHSREIFCVQILPSEQLVSGSFDGAIKIWDINSGTCVKTLKGHSMFVSCLKDAAFRPVG